MAVNIAFFDLDGTLLTKPSSERRFFRWLWRHRKLGFRQLIAAAWFFPRRYARFGKDTHRKNKAYLSGLKVEDIERWAQHWADSYLDSLLDRQIIAEVQRCRESGYRLVLLTGTPAFLAKPIARHLCMDDYIATACAVEQQRFTSAPPGQHPLGYEKLTLAQSYCLTHKAQLKDCVAYGDSHQDCYLLNAVGKAVAVNPDRRMTAQAGNNNWLVITSG